MAENKGDVVTTSVGERPDRQPVTGQWAPVSGPQRSVPAAARPAPPAPAKPTRARRRPALVALGLALMALSVLASVYLTSTLGETRKVLAVTTAIERGEVIEAGDLAPVDLPMGPTILKPVDAGLLASVEGQRAQTELLPGQLLTEGTFAQRVAPADGMAIVGVALAPNQLPTLDLHSGDTVRIVETPVSGGEPPVEDPYSIPATVVSSETTALGDQVVVDVEVDKDFAAALAARAATGRVALVLDAPAGADGDG